MCQVSPAGDTGQSCRPAGPWKSFSAAVGSEGWRQSSSHPRDPGNFRHCTEGAKRSQPSRLPTPGTELQQSLLTTCWVASTWIQDRRSSAPHRLTRSVQAGETHRGIPLRSRDRAQLSRMISKFRQRKVRRGWPAGLSRPRAPNPRACSFPRRLEQEFGRQPGRLSTARMYNHSNRSYPKIPRSWRTSAQE